MKKYHGIIVPAVTPLSDAWTVDPEGTEKLLESVIRGGVNGIFILGSTGEGPALSAREQRRLIALAVKITAHRVPLLVGISGASGADTIEAGRYAIQSGADAVVAAVPCYLPNTDREILHYYRTLAQEIPGDIFAYNMPALVKKSFSPELAAEILALDGIAGYKDSSGDLVALRRVLEIAGETAKRKCVFIGPEHLTLQALAMGVDGGVNGGANLRPELFAALYRAFLERDAARADELQHEVLSLQSIYGDPCTCASVIRGLKYQLAQRGIIKNILAFPSLPLENGERA